MITHRVPIDDFPALYAAFDKRQDNVEKVFVETKFSSPPGEGCPALSRVADWDQTPQSGSKSDVVQGSLDGYRCPPMSANLMSLLQLLARKVLEGPKSESNAYCKDIDLYKIALYQCNDSSFEGVKFNVSPKSI